MNSRADGRFEPGTNLVHLFRNQALEVEVGVCVCGKQSSKIFILFFWLGEHGMQRKDVGGGSVVKHYDTAQIKSVP